MGEELNGIYYSFKFAPSLLTPILSYLIFFFLKIISLNMKQFTGLISFMEIP